ncbi:MAG: LamG domain-containing protein [Planctomycetota bacterium]|nr:LamG domain-containing protein [Planctomycetota bacterium]
MVIRVVLVLLWTSFASAQILPVTHWRLDETTGTVAMDSSASGNHGTLAGFGAAPWTTGALGGALSFLGAQQVDVTMALALPAYDASGSPYSIAFWVKAPPQNERKIYAEASSGSVLPIYTLGTGRVGAGTMDRLRFVLRTSTGIYLKKAESTYPVFDNTWHHVALVDDGGAVTLYVDGQANLGNYSYTIVGNQGNVDRVTLGAMAGAGACCNFIGLLDDFRIYGYAMSVFDVATVMADGVLVSGYQQNQPGASLTVMGAVGSFTSAPQLLLAPGQVFPMVLSTILPGNPWEMGVGTVPAIPAATVLSANIINLDLSSPSLSLLNNSFSTPFAVTLGLPGGGVGVGSATAVVSMQAPITTTLVSLQFGLVDPSNPDGVVISAPVTLAVP